MITPQMHEEDVAAPNRTGDADIVNAGLTPDELRTRIIEAEDFHDQFLAHAFCDEQGLRLLRAPGWAEKFIRRNGDVANAVLAKLGSNLFAKRRPTEVRPFLDYVTQCFAARRTLQLRIVFGPVKNVQRYGTYQLADMAEYLTLIQLARVVESIAAIYPYGVKVQMVPDDKRGHAANLWPAFYSSLYVSSVQRMAQNLQFAAWLTVEEGQTALYNEYQVSSYREVAEREIRADANFETKFAHACRQAEENLFSPANAELSQQEVADSAMRYLIAHKTECLSGMWSPIDALPLMYANHPNNFQLHTLGRGMTKLPWQVRLPFAVLTSQERESVPLPLRRSLKPSA